VITLYEIHHTQRPGFYRWGRYYSIQIDAGQRFTIRLLGQPIMSDDLDSVTVHPVSITRADFCVDGSECIRLPTRGWRSLL